MLRILEPLPAHIFDWPYSLSSFEFSGILYVTHQEFNF